VARARERATTSEGPQTQIKDLTKEELGQMIRLAVASSPKTMGANRVTGASVQKLLRAFGKLGVGSPALLFLPPLGCR
jgi:hypothetical protein